LTKGDSWEFFEGHFQVKVTVKLFASLRKDRFSVDDFEYQEGATVGHILVSLHIPEEEAAIIFINGRHAEPASPLKEGDLLAIFPPVGGG
jgi:molybdopterin converting factor small subunit